MNAAEQRRATTSAALLSGIITSHFALEENHLAVITAWCVYIVSIIASCERSGIPVRGAILESLSTAESAIKDSLVGLWNEIQARRHLIEGDPISDTEIFRWRQTLLCGLLSTLWFFPNSTKEDSARHEEIAKWLNHPEKHWDLWGEGAVPTLLAYLFFLRNTDATMRPDYELAALFSAIVRANQYRSKQALPDPYYSFEEVCRLRYNLQASEGSWNISEETFNGSAHTAELLLHLLARARLKSACRNNWAEFNRLGHRRFVPAAIWQYGLLSCADGTEETKLYPPEYEWGQLCVDASKVDCEYLPAELASRPHILMLWVIIAPHRLTSDVGRLLAHKFLT